MITGFDINSDRFNVIVIDSDGDIIAMRTFWYSETIPHSFPREKAKCIRLL